MCNWADTYELKMEGATSFMNEIDWSYTIKKYFVYVYAGIGWLYRQVFVKIETLQYTYTKLIEVWLLKSFEIEFEWNY